MEMSPEKLCDDVCDKALEEVYPTDISSTMLSDLSPNLQGSSNGQPLFADSFGHNANASPQLTSDESLDLPWWVSPIRGGSRIRMVQDSSGEKRWFLESPKTFEQNANAGPQVTSDESIPAWMGPLMSASGESSQYFSGHSNPYSTFPHGPKIPVMHCGQKRQDTTDNFNVGFYRYPQKCRRLPSLGSISTQPSSSFSSMENPKLFFDNLIALPLEVLSDPEKETSMKNVLSILADNLSLFSEKQGDQILGLLLEFPALVRNWRECYSQFQMYRQQSFAETEKIRDLVENSGKDEEILKFRYEELENNVKELMKQLEAVQKEKAEIAEQRIGKSKQTKDLMEKEAHRNKEERLMRIATAKLNNLSVQWAKLQSFFI